MLNISSCVLKREHSFYPIDSMENSTVAVPVELANGVIVRVQATTGEANSPSTSVGEEVESDVSLNLRPLKEINDAIEGIAATIKAAVDNVKPTKATVEFGLEFEFQAGQLTALIIQGSEKANLKISLEWESGKG